MKSLTDSRTLPIISILVLAATLWLFPSNVAEAFWSTVGGAINEFIYTIAIIIGGTFLTLGGGILDFSIRFLVIQMGDWFQPGSGLGVAVNLGWTMIRDVMNMFFIFGLIFIGIKTILNSEDSGTRRALGYLIAAALLINFSLFITQLIVDFTNLMSVQIYNQIYTEPVQTAAPGTATEFATPIVNAFMTAIGFSGLFGDGYSISDVESVGAGFAFAIMTLVFLVVAGIAFALGAIMIITRFVALILYMIFSPLMFMGWILPKFQSLATTWWRGFFKYSFFAPVYLFLIYISIHMLQGLVASLRGAGIGSSQSVGQEIGGEVDQGFISVTLFFMMMIAMLWASLKIGDKMSIHGSNMALGGLKSAQGVAYRNTAGRLTNRAILGYDFLNRKTDGALGRFGGERARQIAVKARNYGAGGTGLQEVQDASAKRGADSRSRVAADKRVANVRIGEAEAIGDLTDKQLLDGLKDSKTRASLLSNAHLLKNSQIETIKKSDLDDETKESIIDANKENFKEMAKTKEGARAIFKQHKKDITKLPNEVLTSEAFAEHIKDTSTLSKIANIDGLSVEDRRKIKDNVIQAAGGVDDDPEALNDWFENDRQGKKFNA